LYFRHQKYILLNVFMFFDMSSDLENMASYRFDRHIGYQVNSKIESFSINN
jgi:hypothetical protein